MRRWIRLAAALYPRRWRERYSAEFQALIEDVNPGWREFTDVMLGALKMQMSTATTYLKIAGVAARACGRPKAASRRRHASLGSPWGGRPRPRATPWPRSSYFIPATVNFWYICAAFSGVTMMESNT
jgi:hypothetical protein